jgi:hypothetical protein
MQKVFLSVAIFTSIMIPLSAEAASDIQFLSTENIIELKGACLTDVRVELYESENYEVEPIYTATVPCTNDNFQVSDDVLRWDIPEGTYKLVVDGERATVQNFLLKEPVMTIEERVNREAIANNLPSELSKSANDIFESAQASFGEKLYAMQTDFLTMQTVLKDTTYPDFIKVGLGASLGFVGSALENVANAFFVVEKRDFVDTEAVEAPVVEVPVVEAPLPVEEESILPEQTEGMTLLIEGETVEERIAE